MTAPRCLGGRALADHFCDEAHQNATISKLAVKRDSDVVQKLLKVGRDVAFASGGHSFGLEHMAQPPGVQRARTRLRSQLRRKIQDDESLAAREQGTANRRLDGGRKPDPRQGCAAGNTGRGESPGQASRLGSRWRAANLSTLLASDFAVRRPPRTGPSPCRSSAATVRGFRPVKPSPAIRLSDRRRSSLSGIASRISPRVASGRRNVKSLFRF